LLATDIIGCRLTRARNTLDEVASNIRQALLELNGILCHYTGAKEEAWCLFIHA